MRSPERLALHRLLAGYFAALLLSASSLVPAAPPRPDESPQERAHQPPPEALQACQSLGKGATCEFSMPRGKISGRCEAPEGRPLACRPNDMPRPDVQGMPGPSPKGK